MSLKVGALFAGYGGLELGISQALDTDLAWYSEVDKGACKVLEHRFPGMPNVGDVTTVDWSQVEPIDVLSGGSPCQNLSQAGKRAGMTEGTRSNLWVAMREAIAALRPSLVIWENVRGAYSAGADSEVEPCAGCVGDGSRVVLRALGRVLGDLAELGYDARWYGLRAADVGAAHGRFRVFLFATPADADTLGSGWDGWSPEQIGGALSRTATAGGGEGSSPTGERDLTLLPTPAVNDMGASYTPETWDAWTAKMQAAHGNGNGHGASLAIEAQRLLPTPDSPTLSDVTHADSWGKYADAIARWEHLTRPAPAPTEVGPKGNPRLSPRFTEWMMGLPDGWVTDVPGITRNEALRVLGNGVVPQQCAAALRVTLAREVAA